MQLDTSTLTAGTAVAGAIGAALLKLIEGFFNKGKNKFDDSISIRKDLQQEVKDLREEVKRISDDVNEWKRKFYELMVEHSTLKERYMNAQNQIFSLQNEMIDMRRKQSTQDDRNREIDKGKEE